MNVGLVVGLSTVFALATVATVVCALLALRWANTAHAEANRLIQSRGRLIALERTVTKLDDGYRKVWGAVSRLKRRDAPEPEPERDDDATIDFIDDDVEGDIDPQLAALLRSQRRMS